MKRVSYVLGCVVSLHADALSVSQYVVFMSTSSLADGAQLIPTLFVPSAIYAYWASCLTC